MVSRSDIMRIWNSVAWQMGVALPAIDLGDSAKSAAALSKVDATTVARAVEGDGAETFALTILTEKYDESLVLLRALLCWRWLDVLTPGPPLNQPQQSSAARLKKTGKRAAAVTNSTIDRVIDETIVALNPLDAAIHDAAVRRFAKHVASYGGEAVFARDVRFFRRFRTAVAVACLRCAAPAGANKPAPAYGAIPCAALRDACADLQLRAAFPPAVEANDGAAAIRNAILARRRNEAAAEAAIVRLIDGCEAHMALVKVCPRNKANCASGEVCTRGMAEAPAQIDF